MLALLNGVWVMVERFAEAEFWTGRATFTITDDPEAGCFDVWDFDILVLE